MSYFSFMKKFYSLISALLLFFGVGQALAGSGVETRTDEDSSSALLFSVSGKDLKKPSYLYGTIHIVCPADMFSTDVLGSYLSKTERLMLELDLDDPAVMTKAATALNNTDGKTLKDYLTEEQYKKVNELFLSVVGVPVEALSMLNPTGLGIVLSTTPKSTGCPVPSSYESTFVSLAGKSGLAVEGLESVEDQMAAIAKTPAKKQAEDLYKMALKPEKTVNGLKEMMAIYKEQDAEKLLKYIIAESGENPEFTANLLDERNKNWIPKMKAAMTEKSTFFAVGAGHLGGANGVVKLLRAQGYTVTPIKF
jgi:uncharacterized protein YbaP (TraB family)